jgi:hypothetical protein
MICGKIAVSLKILVFAEKGILPGCSDPGEPK